MGVVGSHRRSPAALAVFVLGLLFLIPTGFAGTSGARPQGPGAAEQLLSLTEPTSSWESVVDPALLPELRGAGDGGEFLHVIIEIRDDPFREIALETWREADGKLLALGAPMDPGADPRPSRETLEAVDAIQDAARASIYERAREAVAPDVAIARLSIESVGGRFLGSSPVLPAVFALVPASAVPALAASPWVRWISEDRPVVLEMNTSTFSIRADTYWSAGLTGGIWDLAVMDTGIDPNHPALTVDQARVFHDGGQTNPAYADNPTNPDDLHGHGTHVAGTVASVDATYRGVSYGMDQLINVKAGWLVVGGNGAMYPGDGMLGVDWAVGTAGADVVSLSFGGGTNVGDTPWERFFDAVVDELAVGVAIAAGNSGPNPRTVGEPGAGMNILSVGAVFDGNNGNRADDTLASYSSRGPTGDGRLKPDIAAPGSDITSANAFWEGGPDFVSFSGTSMATPHVAASMILLMDSWGFSAPLRHKALLLHTAEDKGLGGPDTGYGWGYIDLGAAYAARAWVVQGAVDDGGQGYTFYRGQVSGGDRATLVWNRHSDYIGPTYPAFTALNNLDLFSYNEADNTGLASSERTVDNVEQIVAPSSIAANVYKVRGIGTFAEVTQETYALATGPGISAIGPPAIGVTLTFPASAEVGTSFTITADVENTGALTAHGVTVDLTLPGSFVVESGANPQGAGRILAGGTATVSWVVHGTVAGNYGLQAGASSLSYGENFWDLTATQGIAIMDLTPPVSAVDALPPTLTVPSFDVTAAASDGGTVAQVELFYRKDGGAWTSHGTDTSAPWTWTFDTVAAGGDGAYDFYSVAEDASANREAFSGVPDTGTVVDSGPPMSAASELPAYETATTFPVSALATDTGSGVAEVTLHYRRSPGPWTPYGTDTAAPWEWIFDTSVTGGDGTYEFYTLSVDAFGNPEGKTPFPEATTLVDTAAPATTHGLTGTLGANGWYTSGVTVDLAATDGLSGIAYTEIRTDGGPWTPYSGPVLVGGEGSHTVEFYSVDGAGNAETPGSAAFRIDGTPPVTAVTLGGISGTNGWYRSSVTITLQPTDGTSGVGAVRFRLDAGPLVDYSTPIVAFGEGDHVLEFASEDNAGNAEAFQRSDFRIDTLPPSASHVLGGTPGGAGWYTTEVTVTLDSADGGSGIATAQYRVDAGPWLLYGGSVSVPSDGVHVVEYYATDLAGNDGPVGRAEFRTDRTPPAVGVVSPTDGGTVGDSTVPVSWSSSDEGSGISGCSVSLDGGLTVTYTTASSHDFLDVPDGAHIATVTCTDVAGHSNSAEVSFTVHRQLLGLPTTVLALLIVLIVALAILVIAFARRRKEEDEVPAGTSRPRTLPPPPDDLDLPPPPEDLPPPPPPPPPG